MPEKISFEFLKKKDSLVCIDSDGSAMDTMNVKHARCFGPEFVTFYGFEARRNDVQNVWEQINLYSANRGVNRFKGIVLTLEALTQKGFSVEPFDALKQWTESAPKLSLYALQQEFACTGNAQLEKALLWSQAVNRSIKALPQNILQPFKNVYGALKNISQNADIAVVSSANSEALQNEWSRYALTDFTSVLLGQEYGSKSSCICQLLQCGYTPAHVLMVGDAPGDLSGAQENDVHFYPILPCKEIASWDRLTQESIGLLLRNQYDDTYQNALIKEFEESISQYGLDS